MPNNVLTEFDVPAAMRDGVTLRANVFRPAGEGSYPLLSRTPYGKDFATVNSYLDAVRIARAGFTGDDTEHPSHLLLSVIPRA